MKRFFVLTLWQLRLLVKYRIMTVAIIIGVIYTSLLLLFPSLCIESVVVILIFSDPAFMGFIFIGAMILFEKADNTLPAQVVTPMTSMEYLFSKAIALLIPTFIISIGIACSAWKLNFNWMAMIVGVSCTSLIFTFLGIVGVARVRTFNQYIIVIPLFLAPSVLPLLNYFGVTNWSALHAIPTHSSLTVLTNMKAITNLTELALNIGYLLIWLAASFFLALYSFNKHIAE